MKTIKQVTMLSSLLLLSAYTFNTSVMAAEMDHSNMNNVQMKQGGMTDSEMKGGMKCGGMDGSKLKSSKKAGMKCGGMSGGKMNYREMAKKSASIKLQKRTALPESGQAREGGSDGKYNMEPTSSKDSIATQCAKASRGLVMVDNETWARCGGKPEGWSSGPGQAKKVDHSQHNM